MSEYVPFPGRLPLDFTAQMEWRAAAEIALKCLDAVNAASTIARWNEGLLRLQLAAIDTLIAAMARGMMEKTRT